MQRGTGHVICHGHIQASCRYTLYIVTYLGQESSHKFANSQETCSEHSEGWWSSSHHVAQRSINLPEKILIMVLYEAR